METSVRKTSSTSSSEAARRLAVRILCFSLPFWGILALYLHDDPFRVFRRYGCYDSDVMLNEGFVGWNIYLNGKDSLPFNSFILGNSCTMAYPCSEWEACLEPGSRAVRLFGNSETLEGIRLKLLALEQDSAELRNLLIVVDRSALSETRLHSGFGFILPPDISGKSPASVQWEFLQAFCRPDFLIPYLRYRLAGKVSPDMKYMNPYGRIRDPHNNDSFNPRERMIREEGPAYWDRRRNEFPERSGLPDTADPVIRTRQLAVLREMADLVHRHRSSVRIIVSPNYDQQVLHPADRHLLEDLFGKEYVFDFSGINEYTRDIRHYYERHHYRPCVGIRLLRRIYGTGAEADTTSSRSPAAS